MPEGHGFCFTWELSIFPKSFDKSREQKQLFTVQRQEKEDRHALYMSADAVAVTTGTVDLSALSSGGGNLVIGTTTIAIAPTDNLATVIGKINAQTATTQVTASASAANHLVLTSADADTPVTIGGTTTFALLGELGLSVGTTIRPTC